MYNVCQWPPSLTVANSCRQERQQKQTIINRYFLFQTRGVWTLYYCLQGPHDSDVVWGYIIRLSSCTQERQPKRTLTNIYSSKAWTSTPTEVKAIDQKNRPQINQLLCHQLPQWRTLFCWKFDKNISFDKSYMPIWRGKTFFSFMWVRHTK